MNHLFNPVLHTNSFKIANPYHFEEQTCCEKKTTHNSSKQDNGSFCISQKELKCSQIIQTSSLFAWGRLLFKWYILRLTCVCLYSILVPFLSIVSIVILVDFLAVLLVFILLMRFQISKIYRKVYSEKSISSMGPLSSPRSKRSAQFLVYLSCVSICKDKHTF